MQITWKPTHHMEPHNPASNSAANAWPMPAPHCAAPLGHWNFWTEVASRLPWQLSTVSAGAERRYGTKLCRRLQTSSNGRIWSLSLTNIHIFYKFSRTFYILWRPVPWSAFNKNVKLCKFSALYFDTDQDDDKQPEQVYLDKIVYLAGCSFWCKRKSLLR